MLLHDPVYIYFIISMMFCLNEVVYFPVMFQLSGVILRPGFIHGTRHVGNVKVPLGIIGSPLEMVSSHLCGSTLHFN